MAPRKVPITIEYKHHGSQPPIYVAGSFSEPAWEPQEMEYTPTTENEFRFHKEILVEEGGQFQYKFRIGDGDWWALNEDSPTVTDEAGNKNNLLAVPILEHEDDQQQQTSEKQHIKEPETETVPVPEVVVEKVDNEPRHGDDFGEDATVAQKDAHEKRAQDAEPDLVVVKGDVDFEPEKVNGEVDNETQDSVIKPNEDRDDDQADIAAEVAESAAIIDREASPLPIPDEEAGRTGERRLSATPIPQVAETAAEVADSAALLDKEEIRNALPHRLGLFNQSGSGTSTPFHERAPLFAHERLAPYEGELTEPVEPAEEYRESSRRASEYEEEQDFDPNDPSLEEFPEDRISILEHVRSTESRLSADETYFNSSPTSPVIADEEDDGTNHLGEPSPVLLENQGTPSLASITEEDQDVEQPFPLPSPAKNLEEGLGGEVLAVNGGSDGSLVVSELPPGTTVTVDEIQSAEDEHSEAGPEHSLDAIVPPSATVEPEVELLKDESKEEPGLTNTTSADEAPAIVIHPATEPSLTLPHEELSNDEGFEEINHVDSKDFASNVEGGPSAGIIEPILEDIEPTESNAEEAQPTKAEEPVAATSTTEETPFTKSTLGSVVISSIPEVAETAAEVPEAAYFASKSDPEVEETPKSVSDEPDTAKSTSVENNTSKNAELKLRNAPAPDNSETPASLLPKKDAEIKSFWGAVWQTVFVGWIGGLLSRLFGGKRRP